MKENLLPRKIAINSPEESARNDWKKPSSDVDKKDPIIKKLKTNPIGESKKWPHTKEIKKVKYMRLKPEIFFVNNDKKRISANLFKEKKLGKNQISK